MGLPAEVSLENQEFSAHQKTLSLTKSIDVMTKNLVGQASLQDLLNITEVVKCQIDSND